MGILQNNQVACTIQRLSTNGSVQEYAAIAGTHYLMPQNLSSDDIPDGVGDLTKGFKAYAEKGSSFTKGDMVVISSGDFAATYHVRSVQIQNFGGAQHKKIYLEKSTDQA